MKKSRTDMLLDEFAAWASGITLIFILLTIFGTIGFLMFAIAKVIYMLLLT